ncbi:MAG: hypothetical protein WC325_12215 [Candidatus Bathyarchaeia archaeon]
MSSEKLAERLRQIKKENSEPAKTVLDASKPDSSTKSKAAPASKPVPPDDKSGKVYSGKAAFGWIVASVEAGVFIGIFLLRLI